MGITEKNKGVFFAARKSRKEILVQWEPCNPACDVFTIHIYIYHMCAAQNLNSLNFTFK